MCRETRLCCMGLGTRRSESCWGSTTPSPATSVRAKTVGKVCWGAWVKSRMEPRVELGLELDLELGLELELELELGLELELELGLELELELGLELELKSPGQGTLGRELASWSPRPSPMWLMSHLVELRWRWKCRWDVVRWAACRRNASCMRTSGCTTR